MYAPEPSFGVGQRALQQRSDVVRRQRLEVQEQAPRQQRRDQREVGILGGGPDQDDGPVLYDREQDVLLGLAPPVDLVDEQDGGQHAAPGPVHHFPGVGHSGGHGRELDHLAAHALAEDEGEGGLPATGRPPQQEGRQVAGSDQRGQRLPRPEQVTLSYDLVERVRPHASGEWDLGHASTLGETDGPGGRVADRRIFQ